MTSNRPIAGQKLARIEARQVRIPFRRPFVTATSEFTHRRSWIVRLATEDGAVGTGEAAVDPAASETLHGALARLIRQTVPAVAAGRLPDPRELAAEGEAGRAVRAAIDGALASLRAPSAAHPSIARDGLVAVNAVIGYGGPDAGAEAAAQAVEVGFRTLSLPAGTERETDVLVERVRAVRMAVGPEIGLRLDAGGAWDRETAAERLAAVERFRIEFVEQPLPAWDIGGHTSLRELELVPIALDESIDSEAAAVEAVSAHAADVLVVRPARVGGPAVVASIAERAAAARIPVVIGTFFETGVGVATAIRAAARLPRLRDVAHTLATGGVLVHDLLAAPLPVVDGRMPVPGPLVLDEEALERHTIELVEAAG